MAEKKAGGEVRCQRDTISGDLSSTSAAYSPPAGSAQSDSAGFTDAKRADVQPWNPNPGLQLQEQSGPPKARTARQAIIE